MFITSTPKFFCDYYEQTACKCTNAYGYIHIEKAMGKNKYFMRSVPCLLGQMFTADQKNRCHTPNIP